MLMDNVASVQKGLVKFRYIRTYCRAPTKEKAYNMSNDPSKVNLLYRIQVFYHFY